MLQKLASGVKIKAHFGSHSNAVRGWIRSANMIILETTHSTISGIIRLMCLANNMKKKRKCFVEQQRTIDISFEFFVISQTYICPNIVSNCFYNDETIQ